MNRSLIIILLLLLAACDSSKENEESWEKEHVDLILYNGKVYTVDSAFSIASCVVIQNGKIIKVGSESEILDTYAGDQELDLNGAYVYPGFIDAHCHFLGYAQTLMQVDLSGTRSFDEVLARVVEFDDVNQTEWITGRGWDHTDWEVKEFPNNTLLDSLFPDKPVAIRRVDGHALLANSKALEIAGIDENSSFKGGAIVKKNGKLTGVLIDEPADVLLSHMPDFSESEKINALQKATKNCMAVGLTSMHDAGLDKKDALLLKRLTENDSLPFYLHIILSDSKENLDYFLSKEPEFGKKYNISAFKFYADGALGSRGACLLKPYSDVVSEQHFGKMIHDSDYYLKYAKELYEKGYQMCTHCIGDSANRLLLNTYNSVLPIDNDRRWRIEHAQVVNMDDFNMFGEKNIIPSVQPTHATSDMKWSLKRIGRIRIKGAYAYKDLLAENEWIPLGTDFPVEDISPIKTFYAAVTRKSLNPALGQPFNMENALTRIEALMGMTIWAAKAAFMENKIGSLEVGKQANLTVLDTDLIECSNEDIIACKVLYTIIDGEIEHKSN